MENKNNKANAFKHKRQPQVKQLVLKSIVKQIEKRTGASISELKNKYSEETLFAVALKHVTTTKKALCKALDINIDNACRFKRKLEINGLLVQSIDQVICPFTKRSAHLLSTNPKEFERLLKSKSNQTKLFE
ncbi:hypothetical protein [Maribacter thermophilus]|uniref:hypothetical protein n=1 Tax=Maribacter thermophilus TaxID=1197874 RepID=UPI0006414117|nr:hypothetical protein [Maribacter thermophilus]